MKENIAASTQNQALSALLFPYREVLHQGPVPIFALRAKKTGRLKKCTASLPTSPVSIS